MAKLTCIITALAVLVAIVTATSHARQASKKCRYNQYYDEHVDNCAPCREICHAMNITRTEDKCKTECSEYLRAAACTYNQYYDEVVSNCAPCSELCTHHQIKDTTDQCFKECKNYLKSLNCTEEEYFNDHNNTCTACSQLCSQRDQYGNTTQDCFKKCPKYVEKYPPGNIVGPPDVGSPAKTQTAPGKGNTSSKMHPGVIVTIGLGILCLAAAVGVAVYIVKIRRPTYIAAPSTEAVVDDGEGNNANGQVNLEMEGLVADQATQQTSRADLGQNDGRRQEEDHGNGVNFGIQECDPYASSAACFTQLYRESVI